MLSNGHLQKVDGIMKSCCLSSPDEHIRFSMYTIFLDWYELGNWWTNRVMVDCVAHNDMNKGLFGESKGVCGFLFSLFLFFLFYISCLPGEW